MAGLDISKLLQDFAIGGALVVAAVATAAYVNPVAGGIVAAMPLRLGTSIFLTGAHGGSRMAAQMAHGSLLAMPGMVVFLIALPTAIERLGMGLGLAAASIAWLAVTVPVYLLFGK